MRCCLDRPVDTWLLPVPSRVALDPVLLAWFELGPPAAPRDLPANLRMAYSEWQAWVCCAKPLCALVVDATAKIEDSPTGVLRADFANKMIGGGVLGHGCVQEEIMFLLSPELIVARLFVSELTDREALHLIGAERYSSYDGYAAGFRFAGPFVDQGADSSHGAATCCHDPICIVPQV